MEFSDEEIDRIVEAIKEQKYTKEDYVAEVMANNLFALFEPENEEEQKLYEECTKTVAEMVYDFAKKYRQLLQKYERIGLGDTETDEAVVHQIYELIPWTHKYILE